MHAKKSRLLHHHLPHIPEEIVLEEILPRLPVESLLRFRYVSKSWLSLIGSEKFIKTHYENSRKNPRVVLSPILNESTGKVEVCSLRRLLKSSKNEGSSYVDDCTTRPNQQREECFVVGCYNGVVCLLDYANGKQFLLWNPSTRKSTELPTIGEIFLMTSRLLLGKYGFGWDQSRGAYKVFVEIIWTAGVTGRVYSSETGSWKGVSVAGMKRNGCMSGSGLFVGGRLHWFRNGQDEDIESFDLEREVFGRIEPPSAAKSPLIIHPQLHLGEIGGSLSILFEDSETRRLEIWVMKEYGVEDSWQKLLAFPKDKLRSINYGRRSLFGEGPDGEIFVVCGEEVMVYSPRDGTLRSANNGISSIRTAHVYVETFVSPPEPLVRIAENRPRHETKKPVRYNA